MDQRDPKIVEEFRRRRGRQVAVAAAVFAAFGLLIWAERVQPHPLGLTPRSGQIGVLMVVIGAPLFSFKNWRCPKCSRYLGKTWMLRFCPGCGVPLS